MSSNYKNIFCFKFVANNYDVFRHSFPYSSFKCTIKKEKELKADGAVKYGCMPKDAYIPKPLSSTDYSFAIIPTLQSRY